MLNLKITPFLKGSSEPNLHDLGQKNRYFSGKRTFTQDGGGSRSKGTSPSRLTTQFPCSFLNIHGKLRDCLKSCFAPNLTYQNVQDDSPKWLIRRLQRKTTRDDFFQKMTTCVFGIFVCFASWCPYSTIGRYPKMPQKTTGWLNQKSPPFIVNRSCWEHLP